MLANITYIALGGAIGATLRYLTVTSTHYILGREFPYGTFIVNVLGSFLMGLLAILLVEKFTMAFEWRNFLLIGVLGGFTTFSSFSMDTLLLLQAGQITRAIVNILISVILCLAAVWLGFVIGKQI